MKTWLFNIIMTVVCALTIISCTTEEIALEQNEGTVPVQLTLSFSGTPIARDVEDSDDELDYTTQQQNQIENAYILMTDSEGEVLEVIDELTITAQISGGYQLYGRMNKYNDASNIVVLANIKNQGINTNTQDIDTWLKSFEGKSIQSLYEAAIYTNTDTYGWNIASRPIPMWGKTVLNSVSNGGVAATCILYRALAKVNIWVNEKNGFSGFELNKIEVSGQMDRGYCVSEKIADAKIEVQYTETSVPTTAQTGNKVEYNCNGAEKYFSDQIYLPEQVNTSEKSVALKVYYTYNGTQMTKDIIFSDYQWDIIRNHSYIFNISKVTPTTIECKLYYVVEEWDEATINIPNFN